MNGTITIKVEDIELLIKMRDAQKAFFNNRSQQNFNEAKRLERLADAKLSTIKKTLESMKLFASSVGSEERA